MRTAVAAILAAAVVVALAGPTPADATTGSAWTDRSGVHSGAGSSGQQAGRSGGGESGGPVCTYKPVAISDTVAVFDAEDGSRIVPDGTGQWYEEWCDGVFRGSVYVRPANPVDLLAEARRYLPLPLPVPQVNPAGDQIVNLPTWLWLDDGWATQSSTASVPGVSVTVTATPISTVWQMGDGATVICDGPGTPFGTSQARPTCTHTYRRSSAASPSESFTVSATVRWQISWSVAGAAGGGDLGTIDRTASFDLRVAELQAVNTRNG